MPLLPPPSLIVRVVAFATLSSALPAQFAPAHDNTHATHFAPVKSGVMRDEVSAVNKQNPIIGALEALENRRLFDGNGLTGTYYNGITPPDPVSGSPSIISFTRVDPNINFYWGSGAPAPGITADKFSARWVGQIEPRYSETYTFSTRSDEGVRLWIDGKL